MPIGYIVLEYDQVGGVQIVSLLAIASQESRVPDRLNLMYSAFSGVRLMCLMCSLKSLFSDLQQLWLDLDYNISRPWWIGVGPTSGDHPGHGRDYTITLGWRLGACIFYSLYPFLWVVWRFLGRSRVPTLIADKWCHLAKGGVESDSDVGHQVEKINSNDSHPYPAASLVTWPDPTFLIKYRLLGDICSFPSIQVFSSCCSWNCTVWPLLPPRDGCGLIGAAPADKKNQFLPSLRHKVRRVNGHSFWWQWWWAVAEDNINGGGAMVRSSSNRVGGDLLSGKAS